MAMPVARGSGTDSVNTNHGCDTVTTTDQCSDNVFINGKGAVRKGDLIKVHQWPAGEGCEDHTVPLNSYSQTVFVNGKNLGRKGDYYGSNEVIATGSSNVNSG